MVMTAPINTNSITPPQPTLNLKTVVVDTEERARPSIKCDSPVPPRHQPISPRFSITTIEDLQLPQMSLHTHRAHPRNLSPIQCRCLPPINHHHSVRTQSPPPLPCPPPPNLPPSSPCRTGGSSSKVTSLTEPLTEPMTTMSIQEDEDSHPLPRKADPERVLEYGGPNNRYAKVHSTLIYSPFHA